MPFHYANYRLILMTGLLCLTISLPAAEAEPGVDLNAAIDLYRTEGADTALPEFKRLYSTYVVQDDLANAARVDRYIGESHWRLGDYKLSRSHLERALETMHSRGLRLEEGKTLNVLGLLQWDIGN